MYMLVDSTFYQLPYPADTGLSSTFRQLELILSALASARRMAAARSLPNASCGLIDRSCSSAEAFVSKTRLFTAAGASRSHRVKTSWVSPPTHALVYAHRRPQTSVIKNSRSSGNKVRAWDEPKMSRSLRCSAFHISSLALRVTMPGVGCNGNPARAERQTEAAASPSPARSAGRSSMPERFDSSPLGFET